MRGCRSEVQNRGQAPSPAALRAATSPRERGEVSREFTSPHSTKWASRCITKSHLTGWARRGTTCRNLRLVNRSLELNQERRKKNLAPAHAPHWAAPACAAGGSRDGGNATYTKRETRVAGI